MDAFSLHNKTILITGASGGIGSAHVQRLLALGANVIGLVREANKIQAIDGVDYIEVDYTQNSSVETMCNSIGQLDGIVHCAGVVQPFPIKSLSEDKLKETMFINLEVPVMLSRLLLKKKKFNEGASHVFISSISADHPHKGGAAYASSKAALQAFSKVVALETSHLKMRANCISPAMIKTAMYDIAEKGMSKENMDEHISHYPLGMGLPEDVANTSAFLLSNASRWITGINITLDGGFLLEGK